MPPFRLQLTSESLGPRAGCVRDKCGRDYPTASEWHSLAKHPAPEIRPVAGGHDVHRTAKDPAQVSLEAVDSVECFEPTQLWVQINHEVVVTGLSCLAPCNGTEDTDVGSALPQRGAAYRSLVAPQLLKAGHKVAPSGS